MLLNNVGKRAIAHHASNPYRLNQTRLVSRNTLFSFREPFKARRFFYFGAAAGSAIAINHLLSSSFKAEEAEKEYNISDPDLAMKRKSTFDLVSALIVYKLCRVPYFVDLVPELISFIEKIHLSAPMYWIIKRTIFKQFCGGEERSEIVPLMNELLANSIGSILDFSIEADVDDSLDYEQVREASNKRSDSITGQYCQAVRTASSIPGSFVALKVTGLTSPYLLEKVNNIEHYLRNSFILEDKDKDNVLSLEEFKNILTHLPGSNKTIIDKIMSRYDIQEKGSVDWIDYCELLSLTKHENVALISGSEVIHSKMESGQNLKVPFLDINESADLERLIQRLSVICQTALELKVRLMIDAEQSYFQSAIDLVANDLAHKYNSINGSPVVFNTYQLYLKESLSKLCNDLIRAKRNGSPFGAKLVRGAYMVNERKRAAELGLPDIIQDNVESTHHDYNKAIDILLNEIKENNSYMVNFMVASHNSESIAHTCKKIDAMKISPSAVMFGQLYGMQDHATYGLAKRGFSSYKYIPYGPVKEVMPYLIRRAQENSSMMDNVKTEEDQIIQELKKRIFGQPVIA